MILYFSGTGNDKCTGCKTCVRVCPMSNIQLVESRKTKDRPSDLKTLSTLSDSGLSTLSSKSGLVAYIGDNCTICLACVHACPQQAVITNGRETLKERQYRHPDIKLRDLIKR